MKKNMCEMSGCNKVATRKVRNGHRVCEDCMKILRKNHKNLGHNIFFREQRVGTIGGNYGIFVDVAVKFI